MRLAVGIATVGRPEVLNLVLDRLDQQTRRADRVIVCAPNEKDFGGTAARPGVDARIGPRGLTRQRNAIIEAAHDCDILVFFDDDFLPAPTYLAAIEQVFAARDDVVMVTGRVLSDGIIGPGLDFEEAGRILQAAPAIEAQEAQEDGYLWLDEVGNGYGCNMAVLLAPVRTYDCCFDERLPLYGWLEDVDFSRQIRRYGRIVRTNAASGVHLGIKQGRQSGIRLGYSQIANPVYLTRKGTCPWSHAVRLVSRNLGANCLYSFCPEPYIDRSGRVRGNLRALSDLLRGKLHPERILEL
ncbi:MAG: glycosyltransferase [Bryobacterales bacterium]|nr:glycosyltransferase [Bryobacterales bacterium]MBV9018565.1 glycosyltransferase [Alphaproteobacteria bacterium]MBV9151141.1 glycosyltransferase [Alphaproteobacteria bacterium]MBV9964606.1 glycosyltransferase [Alphaproteobacteria bacterium]